MLKQANKSVLNGFLVNYLLRERANGYHADGNRMSVKELIAENAGTASAACRYI